MEHTKGEWEVNDGLVSAKQSNGLLKTICSVNGYTKKEYEANANLIAAAPDLLEALQVAQFELMNLISNTFEATEEKKCIAYLNNHKPYQQVLESIKKAKGEN